LFPIAIHLARGNTIALAPAVLASLYKDLSLFKKQIVDLKKCPEKFPLVLDVNVQSPSYLVQVWVWERFKNLQPQPKLINKEDHVLLRRHKVKPLKIDNVRLALDSAINDFIWRPYVARYVDKCGKFYPNDEMLVPFKKHLDKEMLSFVTCLRVSEVAGFESIEQYLPHRVAMQFGFDQDVPGYVLRCNETEAIAWKHYCRPLSVTSLYFPSRYFEAGITSRYAKWWTKSVLHPQGFVKNDLPQKGSASSPKCRPHAEIPLEIPKLVECDIVTFGKSSGDDSKTRKDDNIVDGDVPSVQDGLKFVGNIDADCPSTSTLPPKHNSLAPLISVEDCNHALEDGNESIDLRMSSETICQSDTQTESYSYLSEVSIAELEQRIS